MASNKKFRCNIIYGDGNPAEGAKVMDQVVEEVREEAYGTNKQPNATKGLSTLRSLMT